MDNLLGQAQALLRDVKYPLSERLIRLCALLQKEVAHYDWVGFYWAKPETRTLHLGPYVGAPTDHTVIPFGKGICGQVAESHTNFVVPDVSAQSNYIACSFTVKSEIVVPLWWQGQNIGQIDIDSHVLDPFTSNDERLLEAINAEISAQLTQSDWDAFVGR